MKSRRKPRTGSLLLLFFCLHCGAAFTFLSPALRWMQGLCRVFRSGSILCTANAAGSSHRARCSCSVFLLLSTSNEMTFSYAVSVCPGGATCPAQQGCVQDTLECSSVAVPVQFLPPLFEAAVLWRNSWWQCIPHTGETNACLCQMWLLFSWAN